VRLASVLAYEETLWALAAEYGGCSPRIPYAFHFNALEWFWSPDAHKCGELVPANCLRCGVTWLPHGQIGSPPRCPKCAKERPEAREWPSHAIAPHIRGEWWLRCRVEGCNEVFANWRKQLYCDEHDSSRLTASKRRVVKPQARR
jgi:hypothetical protein